MPWPGRRIKCPPERLPKSCFLEPHLAECKYCQDEYDKPGPVKMMRDSNTLRLMPDHCNCLLCGQTYFIAYEDLEAFIGFDPRLENLYPQGPVKTRYRSIDEDWKVAPND